MIINRSTRPQALVAGLRSNDVDLLDYLDQLQEHFKRTEPHLQSFLDEPDRWGRLRAEALALLRKYPRAESRPPLFGIPFGVKDIFHVDGYKTQAGSQLPPRALAGKQAQVVSQLKAAGGLVLGKTVTTEFAFFAPGPTRNPHNLAHTPGGSSSGSAAAVASGLVPLALGTQTIGSVIRPASFCGVVGFKPSYGGISALGVIPLSPSLDHVGFFTQDVYFAQSVASVLCANWDSDLTFSNRPTLAVAAGDYLDKAEPEMLDRFRLVVRTLEKAGYWVKHHDAMPDFDEIVERHETILNAEAARVHEDWYRLYSQRYHSRTRQMLEGGQEVEDGELEEALREAGVFSTRISTLMDIHGIDLWLSPGAPGAAPKGLDATGNPVMNLPWTQAGLPTAALPMGKDSRGLPLGLQLTADFGQDEALLAWAADIETLLQRMA